MTCGNGLGFAEELSSTLPRLADSALSLPPQTRAWKSSKILLSPISSFQFRQAWEDGKVDGAALLFCHIRSPWPRSSTPQNQEVLGYGG
jgi:hypothetical protein